MNCTFLETKYFFSPHLSGQGENLGDPLSWLSTTMSVSDNGPPEQVRGSTEPILDNVQSIELSPEQLVSPTGDSVSVSISQTPSTADKSNDVAVTVGASLERDSGGVTDLSGEEEAPTRYVLPPRSTRGIPPKRYEPDYVPRGSKYPVANLAKGRLSEAAGTYTLMVDSETVPRTVKEAEKHKHWKEAMEAEMSALEKNKTWERCILPVGKKMVGCRWVFAIKYRADGTIERHKARLVAKGFTQSYGVDYSETFSPVAKIDTIRVLFSIAANLDWPLHQFDVKNAFLHGNLEEEVYMVPPPGFSKGFRFNEVCRLKNALYGLKQSPRAWFGRFTAAMKTCGYQQSNSDHTLFLKRKGQLVTCLIIYVDDMIITGNDKEEFAELRHQLFKEFEMKDLGRLKYFLGIEVLRSKRGIFMSQRKYILDMLAETGLVDCKSVKTPIVVNHGLKMIEGAELADKERYQRLIGKLIYLSHTRPDIAYAVGVLSQFMHSPQKDHLEAAVRLVRYLKGTVDK